MTKTGQKILEKLAEALARLPPDGKERLLRRGETLAAEKREAGQEPAMAGEEGRRVPAQRPGKDTRAVRKGCGTGTAGKERRDPDDAVHPS
mgnify:CR=1 FL=1